MVRSAWPREIGSDGGDPVALERHVGGDAGAPLPSTTVPLLMSGAGATTPSIYFAASMIVTDFILSPFLTLSTMFMPETTLPNTVYLPSRKYAGASTM